MSLQFAHNDKKFHIGDTLRVHQTIVEDKKTRTQIFEGLLIAISGRQENQSFTVRKIATGSIGVERIFPVNSPFIEKIEVKSQGKVHRSKLYYLRERIGRKALRVGVYKSAKSLAKHNAAKAGKVTAKA